MVKDMIDCASSAVSFISVLLQSLKVSAVFSGKRHTTRVEGP